MDDADDLESLQRQVNLFQKNLDQAKRRDAALTAASEKINSQDAEIAALKVQLKDAQSSSEPPILCDERQARRIIPVSSETFKSLVAGGRLHVIRLNPPRGRKYYRLAELRALAAPEPADRRDETAARSPRLRLPDKLLRSDFTDN
jgi:hypothetical protein